MTFALSIVLCEVSGLLSIDSGVSLHGVFHMHIHEYGLDKVTFVCF